MDIALMIISILWIVAGVLLIIYTDRMKALLEKMCSIKHIKLMAVLPALFGIILILGAFSYREMFWLALILGLIGVLKGIYIILAPPEQITGLMEWYFKKAGDGTIRFFGLIIFILGCAVFSYLI